MNTEPKKSPSQLEDEAQPNANPRTLAGSRFARKRRLRRGGRTAVILLHGGGTEIHQVEGSVIEASDGWYIPEPAGRYWVDEAIPRGWITLYAEGDAEPLGHREPRGYGPRLIRMLCGDMALHLVGAGMTSKLTVKPWMKKALLIAAAGLAVAFFAYRWWINRGA